MKTLSHHDLLALNRAIGEVTTARDLKSYFGSVFSAIQSMVPCELCSCSEVSLSPTAFLKMTHASQTHSTVATKLLPALNAYIHEHPLAPRFFSDNVSKTTDAVSKSQFKNLALYNEYYRHLDIETQIGFSFPIAEGKIALFALSRKAPEFSERDRLMLALLRPHLITALRNATELGRLQLERNLLLRGAEAVRQGAILLQSDGAMLCISPFARELLRKYFAATPAEGEVLPGELLPWFQMETKPDQRNSRGDRKAARDVFTVARDEQRITIQLLSDFTSGDSLLVMTEEDSSPLSRSDLDRYGLSRREKEISTWLAKGKTNAEIALILGMSKRTAEKHLEHIFIKLGVETRTAAAAILKQG